MAEDLLWINKGDRIWLPVGTPKSCMGLFFAVCCCCNLAVVCPPRAHVLGDLVLSVVMATLKTSEGSLGHWGHALGRTWKASLPSCYYFFCDATCMRSSPEPS